MCAWRNNYAWIIMYIVIDSDVLSLCNEVPTSTV